MSDLCDWRSRWDFTQNYLIIMLQMVISLPVCYTLSWGCPSERSFAFFWIRSFFYFHTVEFCHHYFAGVPVCKGQSVVSAFSLLQILARSQGNTLYFPVVFFKLCKRRLMVSSAHGSKSAAEKDFASCAAEYFPNHKSYLISSSSSKSFKCSFEWIELKCTQMLRILSNYDLFSLSSEGDGIKILLALNVSSIKHEKVSQVLQKAVRVKCVWPRVIWHRPEVCFWFSRFLSSEPNANLLKLNMEWNYMEIINHHNHTSSILEIIFNRNKTLAFF